MGQLDQQQDHYLLQRIDLSKRMESKFPEIDEFKVLSTLGDGYHAEVLLGQAPDQSLVAIKKFKSKTASVQTLKNQLSVISSLHHPNLINFIDVRQKSVYKTVNGETSNCFVIIVEYAEGGELFDYIAIGGRFDEVVTRTYFFQLLNAVHYMHEEGFVHRDIKPENIVLTKEYILKLADFGFSTLLQGKDGSGMLHTRLGTDGYMAPEISLKNYEGTKVDIFACGVILFIMYSGSVPFKNSGVMNPHYKLLKDKHYDVFWQYHKKKKPGVYFKQGFKQLFVKMVAHDPSERPTLEQIKENFEWTKGDVVPVSALKQEMDRRRDLIHEQVEKEKIERKKVRIEREEALRRMTSPLNQKQLNKQANIFLKRLKQESEERVQLQTKQLIESCDIIVKQSLQYVISTILTHLSHDVVFKEGNTVVEEYTPSVKRVAKNKFEVRYDFENEENQKESVSLSILLSKDRDNHIIITPKKIQGNCIHIRRVKKMLSKEFCYCRIDK